MVLGRQEAFFKNLRDVKAVFDRAGIRFWLDYGTLLGAVRERRMIEWDSDIDLGTMSDNWDRILHIIPQLQERGFCAFSRLLRIREDFFYRKIYLERYGLAVEMTLYQNVGEYFMAFDVTRKNWHLLPARGLSRIFSRILRTSYSAILMFFSSYTRFYQSLAGDKFGGGNSASKRVGLFSKISTLKLIRLVSTSIPCRAKFRSCVCRLGRLAGIRFIEFAIPNRFFERLGSIEFLGLVFNVPSNAEEYLRYHYGDWHKPRKDWDWTFDDGSIIGYIQQDIDGSTC
jgi:hypothetical protein